MNRVRLKERQDGLNALEEKLEARRNDDEKTKIKQFKNISGLEVKKHFWLGIVDEFRTKIVAYPTV